MDPLRKLLDAVSAGRPVLLRGARGSSAARAAVELHTRTGTHVVWVAADAAGARRALADLIHLDALKLGSEPDEEALEHPEAGTRFLAYPPFLHSPYSDVIPDRARQHVRMSTLFRLAMDLPWSYLVMAASSLGARIPPLEGITARSDMLRPGIAVDRGGKCI